MRIDFHSSPQPASEAECNRAQQASAADRLGQTSASGEDQAQLSGAGAQAQALAAQAAQLPEIRAEKVQSLREAVAGGRYRFDAQKIAEAMLSHMLEAPAG
jgi:flagellar biosynthesis anti-sigma factor FlgM